MTDMESEWRKSSRCGSNACVEVGFDQPAGVVFVRDSTEPGTELAVDREDWAAFVAGVKAGEFDWPAVSGMTDREALQDLLHRFNLTPSTSAPDLVEWARLGAIVLEAKEGGVEGYSGFVTVFQFDDDGKFESVHLSE